MSEKSMTAEPHEDTWHYLTDRDPKHEGNYVEWKYFNFTAPDLCGYIVYFLADPERKTKVGGGRLLLRILKDGKAYGNIKKISMNDVELDETSASMRMGDASIVEHSPHNYEVRSTGEEVSWDLIYRQSAPSIESFQNIRSSLIPWEKVNWLIKMPRATVQGEIRIGQEVFRIDGTGYSDTNWGEMVPFFTHYEWGQYNSKDFSLVFGILYGIEKIKFNYFYLILGEHLIDLSDSDCRAEHVKWEEDEAIQIKIPSENIFSAKKGEYELKFKTTLLSHDTPGLKVNLFLPRVIVSEQIVEYEGALYQNGELIRQWKGKGFEEWSGKTWQDAPVEF